MGGLAMTASLILSIMAVLAAIVCVLVWVPWWAIAGIIVLMVGSAEVAVREFRRQAPLLGGER